MQLRGTCKTESVFTARFAVIDNVQGFEKSKLEKSKDIELVAWLIIVCARVLICLLITPAFWMTASKSRQENDVVLCT